MDRRSLLKNMILSGIPGSWLLKQELQAAPALAAEASDFRNDTPYFIEINLRDQWDFSHAFPAPSLAFDANLSRSNPGDTAFFFQPGDCKKINIPGSPGLVLTPDSLCLAPHAETIAVFETCDFVGGNIHGHQAANTLRSPGCKNGNDSPGLFPLWREDDNPPSGHPEGINEPIYGNVPTPACLHSHLQSTLAGGPRGIVFRGLSRTGVVYHYYGPLTGGSLSKYFIRDTLFSAFDKVSKELEISPDEKKKIYAVLKTFDKPFLKGLGYSDEAVDRYHTILANGFFEAGRKPVVLQLSEEEKDFWQGSEANRVPDQVGEKIKGQIWEQAAWAFKLIEQDASRSIVLEFDYADNHALRTPEYMSVMSKQTALPLARLIQKLKEAGLYDKTLIAIYTTDNSRTPRRNSDGHANGKNAVVFAGGRIRGGYYGDIVTNGYTKSQQDYRYLVPDDNGMPVNTNARFDSTRLWKFVADYLGTPKSILEAFPKVTQARPLTFLKR